MKIYREVLCPKCEKKYMSSFEKEEYDIIFLDGSRNNGWLDVCPKCELNLFVENNVLSGILMDDIESLPECSYKRYYRLR